MTIFHQFLWTGIVAGFCIGFHYGCRFGIIGAILGALVGCYLGYLVGNLPWKITEYFTFRDLRHKSVSQLYEHLQDGSGAANFIAYELRQRGEPAGKVLEAIISMLDSENIRQQYSGRVALNWAFPEATKYALDFKPGRSKEERQESIEEIKQFLLKSTSEKCPVAGAENQ